MRTRCGLIIALSTLFAIFLAGTASAQGLRCEKVQAYLRGFVNFSDEEECLEGGYVWCKAGEVVGTINGRRLELDTGTGEWTFDSPEFGDTGVWRGPVIYETNHGEIWTDTVGMNFVLVYQTLGVGRGLETQLVVGGTGRYEGAIGVITAVWEGPAGIGELSGEICWPEE